jgi:hypothetical protein
MTELIRLLDTVTVAPATAPGEPTLVAHGPRLLRIRGAGGAVDAALDRLREGVAETALADGESREVRSLVTTLGRLGWLTREPVPRAAGVAWDRQVGWWTTLTDAPLAAQRRLTAARVAVVGLGGVGALVLQHLVAGGVRHLWLIDHDTVAAHNLNRQYLYGRSDIGRPKAEAAVASLSRLADDLCLNPVRLRVTRPADLDVLADPPDLLIVAADTPPDLMDTVWTWAQPRGVPVLGAGVGLESGYWGPLLDPRRGHCWFCEEERRLARLSADERRLEASAGPTPYSFGPTNALIADLVARDAMLYLALGRCASLGRRQIIDVLGVGLPSAAATAGPDGSGGSGGPEAAAPEAAPGGCRRHTGGIS